MLVILNYMHYVLIDNGSLIDILYLPTFNQMGIKRDKLKLVQTPLVEFTGDRLLPLIAIGLLVIVRAGDQQVTRVVDLLVVDCASTYNVILGRPSLNQLRVVISTYHLLMRFSIEGRVGKVKGDQVTARECYVVSLKGNFSPKETMTIDGLEVQDERTQIVSEP